MMKFFKKKSSSKSNDSISQKKSKKLKGKTDVYNFNNNEQQNQTSSYKQYESNINGENEQNTQINRPFQPPEYNRVQVQTTQNSFIINNNNNNAADESMVSSIQSEEESETSYNNINSVSIDKEDSILNRKNLGNTTTQGYTQNDSSMVQNSTGHRHHHKHHHKHHHHHRSRGTTATNMTTTTNNDITASNTITKTSDIDIMAFMSRGSNNDSDKPEASNSKSLFDDIMESFTTYKETGVLQSTTTTTTSNEHSK